MIPAASDAAAHFVREAAVESVITNHVILRGIVLQSMQCIVVVSQNAVVKLCRDLAGRAEIMIELYIPCVMLSLSLNKRWCFPLLVGQAM
jgi:hypothetical protein